MADGSSSVTITAPNLEDALGVLLEAVGTLLEGGMRLACSWEEEPGEYRGALSAQVEIVPDYEPEVDGRVVMSRRPGGLRLPRDGAERRCRSRQLLFMYQGSRGRGGRLLRRQDEQV